MIVDCIQFYIIYTSRARQEIKQKIKRKKGRIEEESCGISKRGRGRERKGSKCCFCPLPPKALTNYY